MAITFGKPRKRRKNGVLSSTYWVRCYDDIYKRQTWRSTRCRSFKAAAEQVRTWEMEQALGKERRAARDQQSKTFAGALEEWLAVKGDTVSTQHRKGLETFAQFWRSYFNEMPLADVDAECVREYLAKRRKGTVRKDWRPRAVSATTVNNDRRYLGGFFKFCRRNGWMVHNPMDGADKLPGEMRRRTRYISKADEEKLLAACRDPEQVAVKAKRNVGGRDGGASSKTASEFFQTVHPPDYLYPLVLVAIRCGFRRRTLLSLRWRDVDLDGKQWRIPAEFMKTSEDYHAPVPGSVVEALVGYRARLRAAGGDARGTKKKLVTKSAVRARLAPNTTIFGLTPESNIKKSFQRAVRRAGLSLTFHDLRRVFLNRCREQGISIETAMALSQHRSLATVLKHYREVPERDLVEAVERLDGV